jgi:D-sedoheptulose 7-phosphate isomerase
MKKNNFIFEIKNKLTEIDNKKLEKGLSIIKKMPKENKIILAGNGASAAISSHLAIDFTKAAGVRAINFNESSLLTCFSNDFGYENWIKKALDYYMLSGDIVILVSSSGKSKNVINAAKFTKKNRNILITLTGLDEKNPLKKLGDINFFVKSKNYNVVESIHLIILLSIVEKLIKKKN